MQNDMIPEWQNRTGKDLRASIGFALAMIKEAELTNLWIVVGNKWFSPKEFEAHYPTKIIGESRMLVYNQNDIKLKDPIEAIEKMRADLEKKEKVLSEFSVKVIKYYRDERGKN